jgi:Carboxypeptidase regulatory-like domain/TonB dependent receptor-like, beta-barrel/TonB-dependent Receptor Plug Domain
MRGNGRITLLALGLGALALILGGQIPARGQAAGTGSITGTVKDVSGAVVPQARVLVRNVDTGAERDLRTSQAGLYSAPYLQSGTYEIRVNKPGFAEVVRKGLVLQVGRTLNVDIQLPLRTAQQTVTVTGAAPLIDTQKTDVSQVISSAQVQNLPLNGRRWSDLLLLTPGVSEDGAYGLVSYRGISGLYNNNMVDGADNNQAFFSEARGRTRLPYGYSLDAIKEFQVVNSAYSAEYGRAAGGIINAVTKSGANDFHGDAFYYIRDSSWLAQDPIANASGQPQPPERRQQFGGSVGGPIAKNKLFFFANYDEQKRNFPAIITPSVPSVWNQQIATCLADASLASACRQVAGALNAEFNTTIPRTGDNYIGLGKLDWQITRNNRLSGEVNILRWDSPNGIQTQPVLNVAESANGGDFVHDQFVNAHWSSVLTPNVVNELRFQWGEDLEFENANQSGPNFGFSTGSIGGASFGMPNYLPRGLFPDENRYEWIDNLSWMRGRHQFKAGADVNHVNDNIQNLFNGGGVYSYSGSAALRDFVSDITNGTRHYRNFIQAIDPITGSGSGQFTTNDYDFYGQDSFRWTPNFTVNFGLRYEIQVMPTPPKPNPAVPETSRINTDSNNFGPRIGLAWDIGGRQRQVVRAGYGMYYGLTQNSTIFDAMFQNGIYQQSFTVTPALGPGCAPQVPNLLFPQPNTAPAFGPIFPSGPTPSAQYANLAAFETGCPAAGASSTIYIVDPTYVNPLIHEYDVAYELQLPGHFAFTADYIGSRGLHLPIVVDANLPPPDTTATYLLYKANGQLAGPPQFTLPYFSGKVPRPRAGLGALPEIKSVVNSWYNGLVLQVRRQFSQGFLFSANYTWSKSVDNGQVDGGGGTFFGTVSPLNPYDLKAEYGPSDMNMPQRFVANFYWAAPFGNWVRSDAAKRLAGGWQFSGIVRAQTGYPVTEFMGSSPFCPRGTDYSLTCGAISGFAGFTNGRVPFLTRNGQVTTPSVYLVDFRVNRKFRISENTSFEFIWEAFNLFNFTNVFSVNDVAYNFSSPRSGGCPAAITTAPGGIYGGCVRPATAFLAPESTSTSLYGARQMQFGARFTF